MMDLVRDWTKYIEPSVNENSHAINYDWDLVSYVEDSTSRTTDMITLLSIDEMKDWSRLINAKALTDFAVINNGFKSDYTINNGEQAGLYWLRSAGGKVMRGHYAYYVSSTGDTDLHYVDNPVIGVSPFLRLRLPENVTFKNAAQTLGPLEAMDFHDLDGNTERYYTIALGEYPKTAALAEEGRVLESLYNGGWLYGGLESTGRLYTTNGQRRGGQDFCAKQNPEFIYRGQKYVRSIVWGRESIFADPRTLVHQPQTGEVQWIRVEPITFRILNSREFAADQTRVLQLDCRDIILSGIPFYPNQDHDYSSSWQNSLLRSFLNSADSHALDGEKERAKLQWDFRGRGFMDQAFNMTREATREYTIPAAETEIASYAFNGCVGLQKITIPSHVTNIGEQAFSGCVNAQVILSGLNPKLTLKTSSFTGTNFKYVYYAKKGQAIILSPWQDANLTQDYYERPFRLDEMECVLQDNYRKNFVQLKTWRESGKIRFIPPEFTIQIFPAGEMKNYFFNNNHHRWGQLVRGLGFDTLPDEEKVNALTDLMKIYYALGGFSRHQGESERAFDYVQKYVAVGQNPNATPNEVGAAVHQRFSRLELNGPYNPTFAKFMMRYYHRNPDFMCFNLYDKQGKLQPVQDYLCMAHNAFPIILKNYPNRVVNGNEEKALLSPYFVAVHAEYVHYRGVRPGNEQLAEMVGRYGYSQKQFDDIQDIYEQAKTIQNQFVLQADRSDEKHGVSYRLLAKNDPLGFVLGDITNCCQHMGGLGEPCVRDGYINPRAGFLVFEESNQDDAAGEKRILGQAYTWYDPETATVCLDNIEMPTKVFTELTKGDKHQAKLSMNTLLDAVVDSADAMLSSMNRHGTKLKRVTIGKGYNAIKTQLEARFGAAEQNPRAVHRGYTGYSDARYAQFIIRDEEQTR